MIAGVIPCHPHNYTKGRRTKIQYLVMHYTGNNGDTAKGNCMYFSKPTKYRTSAHYFVDEQSVWLSVQESDTAHHSGDTRYKHPYCRNANALSIEMCSRVDSRGNYYIKPETVANAVRLAKELIVKYDIPLENVLRHFDVTGKDCPRPWVRDVSQWRKFLESLKEDKPMDVKEAKNIVKEKAGLSDDTIAYIADFYKYGEFAIIKLAEAMK